MNVETVFLGHKTFLLSDQIKFAQYSGDKNPIHIDPTEARKTIAGECIVHGIHAFLWALSLLAARENTIPKAYRVTFKNAVNLNKDVHCTWDRASQRLKIIGQYDELLVSIKGKGALQLPTNQDNLILNAPKKLNSPRKTQVEGFSVGACFESECGGDFSLGDDLFPDLNKKLGAYLTYEIAILSNIVGMQIPGLRSLFTSCEIDIRREDIAPVYSVESFDSRFNKIDLEYSGKNLTAKMEAFVRPENVAPLNCIEIKEKLKFTGRFDGRRVLVIGGSRGIGAWVAKVVGILGGDVTITYSLGEEEAAAVCSDINTNTKSNAESCRFDVTKDRYKDHFNENFDDFYYFATPRIFGKKSSVFEQDRYDLLFEFYCTIFKKIAIEFIENGGSKIFYPSTIAVEQDIKGLEEYKKAKLAGEQICLNLEQSSNVKVIIDRLDRVRTDQTLSISNAPALSPLDAAEDSVRKML